MKVICLLKPPGLRIHDSQFPIRLSRAFTLIELLVVISILGLMAGLAVPALKNLGKSNTIAGAARQMLDDVGRARQLAISQHTTVYMVFVKTNYWFAPAWPNLWWKNQLTLAQQTIGTNLADRQLTGYNFVSLRSVGDQPGRGSTRYHASAWQKLPAGSFIAQQKFQAPGQYFTIPDFDPNLQIHGFNVTNTLPFPTEDSVLPPTTIKFPYIAFNYLGQLTVDGQNLANQDEYIPLAQGTVSPAIDGTTKAYILGAAAAPSVSENPPGNSTNIAYNIVHIDRLTGRATLEYYKVH